MAVPGPGGRTLPGEPADQGVAGWKPAPEVVSIEHDHVTLKIPNGVREMVNDRVIIQIGGQPPSELLRTIGIELVEKWGEA